eukprot:1446416-Prymnesium_polylepis.1
MLGAAPQRPCEVPRAVVARAPAVAVRGVVVRVEDDRVAHLRLQFEAQCRELGLPTLKVAGQVDEDARHACRSAMIHQVVARRAIGVLVVSRLLAVREQLEVDPAHRVEPRVTAQSLAHLVHQGLLARVDGERLT